ncbi:putative ribosomal protein L4 domain superfamily [Arabidopsis thaliana]
MCRSGRMFAPTKTHRLWHRRVNVNLKQHAIVSTIAETSVPRAVLKKNLNVMLKLNPYAKTARRMSLLAEADRVKSKKEKLERKRKPISNEEA